MTGLGNLAGYAADQVEISAWGILALFGITAVVAGSLLERVDFARCLAVWRADTADWAREGLVQQPANSTNGNL